MLLALIIALGACAPPERQTPPPPAESKLDAPLRALLRGEPAGNLVQVTTVQGVEMVEVLIQARRDISPDLQSLGAQVRSVINNETTLISADIPVNAIAAIAQIPDLVSMRASRPVHRKP